MKKIVFLFVFVSAFVLTSQAQLSFGLKAGANFASQSLKVSPYHASLDVSGVVGFHGGVYAKGKFGKFGAQVEACYSQQGSMILDPRGEDFEFNLTYINFPILFRYNITDWLNIHSGPQYGLLISAKEKHLGASVDVKSNYQSADMSGVVGVGIDLPSGSVGIRYAGGLTNFVNRSSHFDAGWNYMLQVYFGYKLLGK